MLSLGSILLLNYLVPQKWQTELTHLNKNTKIPCHVEGPNVLSETQEEEVEEPFVADKESCQHW